MGFTGMFSVETILKIIGFGVKVGANNNKTFKLLIVLKTKSQSKCIDNNLKWTFDC